MEEFKSILLSVMAGVITSFLIYSLGVIFKKIIIPWYQRLIYRGADISGEWIGSIVRSDTLKFELYLELKQSAHFVSGTYTSTRFVDGVSTSTSTMIVKGTLWEGFLNLQCRTISNKRLSFGTMLLQVNTNQLLGKQVFRNLNPSGESIVSFDLLFKPK